MRVLPLVVSIALGLLSACADTNFVGSDGGAPDREPNGDQSNLWPDIGPLPDGMGGSAAQTMYAQSKTQLFIIDPGTLQVSLVGSFTPNAPDMNDIAVTPKGVLYAISVNDLYRVDHHTGQITWITKVEGTANVALTFEPSGTLLASDKDGVFRRIDPQTGAVEKIGTYGDGFGSSGDLVAVRDGTLYEVNDVGCKENNQLLSVDPATGKATVIGSIGYAQVWGLAYWKGTIYGLTKAGDLLAIDPKTGKGSLVHSYPFEFWGAAVTPLAPID